MPAILGLVVRHGIGNWRDVEGRTDTRGHSPTLEAAMADFRGAWDRPESGVA